MEELAGLSEETWKLALDRFHLLQGASSRLLQYTVSMRVIFDGAAVWAATAYEPASGEASSRETKDLRLSDMAEL
jgi:hypothetical protein